jgi:hypothetical protein
LTVGIGGNGGSTGNGGNLLLLGVSAGREGNGGKLLFCNGRDTTALLARVPTLWAGTTLPVERFGNWALSAGVKLIIFTLLKAFLIVLEDEIEDILGRNIAKIAI